ncbi:MAG: murein L,D-transpeptidase catalytic domain-containing protein, partial [Bacteroidia bacterium]
IDRMVKFAKNEGYNPHLGIFINLRKHSGSNRLFLVDLDSQRTLLAGLCCHGKGKSGIKESASFSNTVGGNCSSSGFYKIGYKYNGTFGTAYKLTGLNETNSNAFERFVVLHGHDCVPASPVPVSICQSLGCPTLAPEVLKKLEPFLDKSKQPVLIWIF